MAEDAPEPGPGAAGAGSDGEGKRKRKLPPNPRRRIKQKASAPAAAAPTPAGAPPADAGGAVAPEERKRRAEQRRRREIALKVRAEGKKYNPHKLRKAMGPADGARGDKGGAKVKRADRVKLKAGQAHRCSHQEKQDVLAAAHGAAGALRGAGLDVAIDEGDKYTPGQKVRLEIGPKEALASTAVLALTTAPGAVANKSSVRLAAPVLTKRVLGALRDQGVELPAAAEAAAAAAGLGGGEGGGAAAAAAGPKAGAEGGGGAAAAAGPRAGAEGGGGAAAAAGADQKVKDKATAKAEKKKRKSEGEAAAGGEEGGAAAGGGGGGGGGGKKSKKKDKGGGGNGGGGAAAEAAAGGGESAAAAAAAAEAPKKKKKKGADADAAAEAAAAPPPAAAAAAQPPPKARKESFVSGDALDDFDIDVDADEARLLGGGKKAKGKRDKHHRLIAGGKKGGGGGGGEGGSGGEGGDGGGEGAKKKNKAKPSLSFPKHLSASLGIQETLGAGGPESPLEPAWANGAKMYDEQALAEAEARWWMLCYKVQPCMEPMPHDWATCPQQHHNEKAARRCPRAYRYAAMRCPQRNKKSPSGDSRAACAKGDACGCAHTVYELWLHPDRFRTQMCLHGTACTKPLCFFAHTTAELRTPSSQAQAAAAGAPPPPPPPPPGSSPPAPKVPSEASKAAAARLDDGHDPAEALLEIYAAVGGGRFCLAAALAEVQLRQRQLYGCAPPGARPPAPPAAAFAAAGAGAHGAAAWQLALLQAADGGDAAAAAALGGLLPGGAAAAAYAALQHQAALLLPAVDLRAAAALGASPGSAALLQQLALRQSLLGGGGGGGFTHLQADGGLAGQVAGSAPPQLSACWLPAHGAGAGWLGGGGGGGGGWDALGSPGGLAAAAGLLPPASCAPAGPRSPQAGERGAGAPRRNSLLWQLELDGGGGDGGAAAAGTPPGAGGLAALVARSASGSSAEGGLLSAAASSGLGGPGSGIPSLQGGSGAASPVSARALGGGDGGALGLPPAGAGDAGLMGHHSASGLHQQLERLRLEHEQQALRLRALQLHCAQGGSLAAGALSGGLLQALKSSPGAVSGTGWHLYMHARTHAAEHPSSRTSDLSFAAGRGAAGAARRKPVGHCNRAYFQSYTSGTAKRFSSPFLRQFDVSHAGLRSADEAIVMREQCVAYSGAVWFSIT
ncbi:MAG: hypothetical protein J3K34DRAFT_491752 [Monoraphidium minutum]|nr:MAG: hypothetical protein J3K34DRAFT_491752 [Monoraphidium minutum]